jgi:hypothetical protein
MKSEIIKEEENIKYATLSKKYLGFPYLYS